MPRQKITRDMVLEAAFSIARSWGPEQVMVKHIAAALGCSVQPIYSYCENMDALREDLAHMASQFLRQYVSRHVDRHDLFRSTGETYLRFAREEPGLFRLYFFRNRPTAASLEDACRQESNPHMLSFLQESLGLDQERAQQLYQHMIIYTMGLSFILASSGGDIPAEEMSAQLERAYDAFFNTVSPESQQT